ncbi:hypothetical protein EIN_412200, partial [Entamoeba invadens IP1]
MILLITVVLALQVDAIWCETSGLISYNKQTSTCALITRGLDISKVDSSKVSITFTESCCSTNEITFDDRSYPADTISQFNFANTEIALSALFVRTGLSSSYVEFGDLYPEGLFVSMGCFGGTSGCRTSVDYGQIGTESARSEFVVQSKGLHLYSDIDQMWIISKNKTVGDKPSYLCIDGTKKQTILFKFNYDYVFGENYGSGRYLFTANSAITYNMALKNPSNGTVSYIQKLVCNRNGVIRYLLFDTGYAGVTDNTECTCKPTTTSVTNDYNFNFPDCRYNSTAFDLDLSMLSGSPISVTISPTANVWYSAIFGASKAYTVTPLPTNTDGITFTKLTIESEKSVTFEMKCTVKTLTINSVGNFYFKGGISIETVSLDSSTNFVNNILFSVDGSFEDKSNLLTKCGRRAVLKTSINTLCDCRYDGSKFTTSDTVNPNLNRDDCVDATLENGLTLVVTGSSYNPTKSGVWKAIKSTSPAIEISLGQFTLSAASCSFGGSVTIPKSTVTCTHFDISQNTQITTQATFSFSTFTATQQLTRSNTSGVVKVLSSGSVPSLSSIQYTGSDFTNCFELISYQSETQQTLDTANTKMLGKKLVRHCGTSTFDYGILCVFLKSEMNNNTSYQNEVLHCPTNTTNTVIQINTASYTQTVQFDGVFSQQITQTSLIKKDAKVSQFQDKSNTVICIDKNSLDKQTISVSQSASKLFVSSSFGFENTAKAMKGATDGVSVVYSSSTNCTAFLVKGITTTCESCRSSYLTNGLCYNYDSSCTNYYQGATSSVCDTCGNGYEAYKYECVSCNTGGATTCTHCVGGKCVECDDWNLVESGVCKGVDRVTTLLHDRGISLKCANGYYSHYDVCLK